MNEVEAVEAVLFGSDQNGNLLFVKPTIAELEKVKGDKQLELQPDGSVVLRRPAETLAEEIVRLRAENEELRTKLINANRRLHYVQEALKR